MPSETTPARQSPTPCPAGWLVPHGEAFLAELEGLGYASGTIGHYRHAIDLFREQVALRGLGPVDIDAAGSGPFRTGWVAWRACQWRLSGSGGRGCSRAHRIGRY